MKGTGALLSLTLVLLVIYGCSAAAPVAEQSPQEKAAAEATVIVQQAEATAIVLRAQGTAQALIAGARAPTPTVVAQAVTGVSAPMEQAGGAMTEEPSPAATLTPQAAATGTAGGKVVLGQVGFGADGGFIVVNFTAPPQIAHAWIQGMMYVVDEATGYKYSEIPVIPVVGPMFAKPKEDGQSGYVMFVNTNGTLRPGAVVTVVLGDFKQEHVVAQ
ncbi:MAG: hypothetical protein ACM3JD_14480 [Rudaea sp.]